MSIQSVTLCVSRLLYAVLMCMCNTAYGQLVPDGEHFFHFLKRKYELARPFLQVLFARREKPVLSIVRPLVRGH